MSRLLNAFLIIGLCLSLLGPAALPVQAQAPSPEDLGHIKEGVRSFLMTIAGLQDLDELAQPIPFNYVHLNGPDSALVGLRPLSPQGMPVLDVATDLFAEIEVQCSGALGSTAILATCLSDQLEKAYGSTDLDLDATISEDGTSITLDVALTLPGASMPAEFAVAHPQLDVLGGASGVDIVLSGSFALEYTPGDQFSLRLPVAGAPAYQVSYGAAFDGGPFAYNLGILSTQIAGTGTAQAGFTAGLLDPDGDGYLTRDEWQSTGFVDLFDVGFTLFNAQLDLDVTTDLPGLDAATGKITLSDFDPSNGLDQPDLQLSGFEDFQNLTPQDFIGGIAQLAILLEAVQVRAGSFQLPFLDVRMDDVSSFNERIVRFFTEHDLSNVEDPLGIEVTPEQLAEIDTVQEIRDRLMTKLGLDPANPADLSAFGMTYQPAGKQLVFNLGLDETPSPAAAGFDFADQLAPAGIVNVQANGEASVQPSYAVDMGIAVDMAATPPENPRPPLERFGFETGGLEFQADAFVDANLDLTAQIGFLGIRLEDDNPGGSVPLLDHRASDSDSMLRVDLEGGAAGTLTFQEFFDLLSASLEPVEGQAGAYVADLGDGKRLNIAINAAVPAFSLNAFALLEDGPGLQAGSLTASWPDITVDLPDISVDPDFQDQLLAFDFDHENPLALLGMVLDALETLTTQLDGNSKSGLLSQDLPLVGASYRDLVGQIGLLSSIADQVQELASEPPFSLQDLEAQINQRIAQALGHAGPVPDFLAVDLDPNGASPAAVNFSLSLGVCSDGSHPGCTVEKALSMPFNLNLGADLPGGIVSVGAGAEGSVDVIYDAVAQLDFGVQLPQVNMGSLSLNAEGEAVFVPPSAAGAAQVYLLDTSQLRLEAGLSASLELSAALGPLTVIVGDVDPSPETGDQCANDLDDDGDDFVNDGCLAGTAESGDQCSNAADDDGDGYINDGCPVAGDDPETGSACANDINDDDPDDDKVNDGCQAGDPEDEGAGECSNALDDDGDGYFNDGCQARGNPATAAMGAKFELFNDLGGDGQPDRILLADEGAVESYVSGLAPAGFHPDAGVECPGIAGTHEACARLPIFVDGDATPIGTITFYTDDIMSDPSAWNVDVPAGILDQLAASILDWGLFFEGILYVSRSLENAMSAGAYGLSVPVLGDALDAGAGLVGKFNDHVLDPLENLDPPDTDPPAVETWLEEQLNTALAPVPGATVDVTFVCGPDKDNLDPCEAADGLLDIFDARVDLSFGATLLEAGFGFDLGFPGLRLAADEPITTDVDWGLGLGFGVNKDGGFYLVTDPSLPLATISTTVHLPPEISGDLAFIRVIISDTTPAPDLEFSLSAGLSNEAGLLYFSSLASSQDPVGFDVNVSGGVHLALGLETTADIGGAGDGALPRVLAGLNLDWEFGTGQPIDSLDNVGGATLAFTDVRLDVGSFFADFMGPALREAQRYTKPLQPVIDTISAPIPGITQLAALVGEPPVSMLTLFDAATDSDLTLVYRVIELVEFINGIGGISSDVILTLGSFTVNLEAASQSSMPAGQKASLVATETPEADDLLGDIFAGHEDLGANAERGFSFPAFENPSSIFSMLVGQDVTLIRWDAGKLEAGFGFSRSFGPIAVGPVPVSLVISGSAKIQGRFAIGYDTRGIRQMVKAYAEGDDSFNNITFLFNGVFIDDLDAEGNDVPEIRLTATLAAGAAVDLVIISAGVEGGVKATIDMNLHDGGLEPVPPDPEDLDGKLRIDEIVSFASNPICMFDVSGKLEAFIAAFVKIDFFFFSKTFRKTIVNIVLLDLKNITAELCKPEPPELVGHDGTALILNIGPRSDLRNYDPDEPDEKITVRQLSLKTGGTATVSVTGFGNVQVFEGVSAIYGDGGPGSDVIIMAEGAVNEEKKDENGQPVLGPDGNPIIVTQVFSFTLPAYLCGGPGDDRLAGGEDSDLLFGDNDDGSIVAGDVDLCAEPGNPGKDSINGNGGDDQIHGGGHADEIGGDAGEDWLYGNAGSDKITGGFGPDHIYGGASDDNEDCDGAPDDDIPWRCDHDDIQGGPEPEPRPATGVTDPDPADPADWKDGVTPAEVIDIISGGPGDDNLEGDVGDDQIHGGAGNDIILGDKGDDAIFGDSGDDRLFGNEGIDTIHGDEGDADTSNDGHDDIFGNDGNDILYGDGGNDDLIGGTDDSAACDGSIGDQIHGGPGLDYLLGDEGIIERHPGDAEGAVQLEGNHPGNDFLWGDNHADLMYGQDGCDQMHGGRGGDKMHGGTGDDVMNGNAGQDHMYGDAGVDTMHGDGDDDTMRGGTENDVMYGDGGGDTMFGDRGMDTMYGDDNVNGTPDGEDVMRGGIGPDTMYGNGAYDQMYGEADDDHLVGGSPDTVSSDTGDLMLGGAGDDVMCGDNADIDETGVETLYAESSIGGADEMYGEAGRDRMFGEYDGDDMYGGPDDDYMEGNDGADEMYGEGEHDDMIGGGDAPGVPDTGETLMSGGPGADVMTGDNARILRAGEGVTLSNPTRWVELLDVPFLGAEVAPNVSGDDIMEGNDADDVMYGQSGDDTMRGNDGHDYMEGNAGQDRMYGGNGPDDMVGGSGFDTPGGELRLLANVLDAGEIEMYGGEDIDYMTGDNALILQDGSRCLQLHDVPFADLPPIAAELSGNDTMHGDDGDDVMYGQSGRDTMYGEADDDYMEGNDGQDMMYGAGGYDDMMGGSGHDWLCLAGGGLRELSNVRDVGEIEMYGGPDDDFMTGDNALILRSGGDLPLGRYIKLYDLQFAGLPFDPAVSGPDVMHGDDGHDWMFGQGNGNQPAQQADPADGVDNDRDGREFAESVGYDCLDGFDNDADGLADGLDLECLAAIDEDAAWLGDTMYGGPGDDYMEGNHGSDWIFGQENEDDLIGGGSANDGIIDLDRVGDGLADSHDVMDGGLEDDVMLGDNGAILRIDTGAGWQRHVGYAYNLAVRLTHMSVLPEAPGAYGHDYMVGRQGHDEMYGQLGDDYMEGNQGDDAMVGDLGQVTTRIEDGSRQQHIRPNEPFFSDTIFVEGTLSRLTELYASDTDQAGQGGADTLLGGSGMDKMHGGPGDDLLNGDAGEDYVFGGDGADDLWGGREHDHLWGGHGKDNLDIWPRPAGDYSDKGKKTIYYDGDPPEWFTYARVENYQDMDIIYGGWGQDAMQADVADMGPTPGDRLIDWVGAYNIFYLCPALYGEYVVTRDHSPAIRGFLEQLAEGDGAWATSQSGTSGFRELAMVFPNQAKYNSHPVHEDTPGHFTCASQGAIVIEKVTEPSPDPSDTAFDFTAAPPLSPESFSLHDGQSQGFSPLAPGTYGIAEVLPDGWALSTTCSDGSDPGAIQLDPGETVVCTFTNVQAEAGLLQVVASWLKDIYRLAQTSLNQTLSTL